MPLKPFGPDAHELALAEHPLRVLVAGQGGAAAAGHLADERHPEDQVGAQRAQEPAGVVVHHHAGHQGVDGQRAGVVGHDQRAALGGDVLDAADLDPEPLLGQRPQRREQELLGDLRVEPELVDLVVAGQPSPQQRQHLGQLRLPLVAPDLAGAVLERRPPGVGGHRTQRTEDPVGGRGSGPRRGRLGQGLGDGLRRLGERLDRHRLGGDLLGDLGRRRTAGARGPGRLGGGCLRAGGTGQAAGGRGRLRLARTPARTAAGPDRDDLGVSHGGSRRLRWRRGSRPAGRAGDRPARPRRARTPATWRASRPRSRRRPRPS